MGTEVTRAVLNLGLGCPGEGAPLIFAQDRTGESRTLEIGSVSGIPGQFIDLGISLSGGGDVTTAQLDVLFDTSVLELGEPATACRIDPRLAAKFSLQAFLPQVPPNPPGVARLRLAVLDLMFPLDTFTDGPLVSCRFRVRPEAAPGSIVLNGFRFEIGDSTGNAFGASVTPGSVTVEPAPPCEDNDDCPDGTECKGGVCKPVIECSGPTAGPTECRDGREACVDNRCVCAADCNNDGRVRGNEISILINIINGRTGVESCRAGDVNGDGRVRGNEVSIAINNINRGCP